jgi:hypothetical protein
MMSPLRQDVEKTAETQRLAEAREGGFLGLDNIGVFDRSAPLPTGGHLEQADGTAWMSLFCQTMLDVDAKRFLEMGNKRFLEVGGTSSTR